MVRSIARAFSLFVFIILAACGSTEPPQAVDWPARRDAALAAARQQEPDVGVEMTHILPFPLSDQNKPLGLNFYFLHPDGTGHCFASSGTSLAMQPMKLCVMSTMTSIDRSYSRQKFVQVALSPEAAIQRALLESQPFIAKYQPNIEISGALQIPSPSWLQNHPDGATHTIWRIRFSAPKAEKQVIFDALTGSIIDTNEAVYR